MGSLSYVIIQVECDANILWVIESQCNLILSPYTRTNPKDANSAEMRNAT